MAPSFGLAFLSFFLFASSIPVSSFATERHFHAQVREPSISLHEKTTHQIIPTFVSQTANNTSANSTADGNIQSTPTRPPPTGVAVGTIITVGTTVNHSTASAPPTVRSTVIGASSAISKKTTAPAVSSTTIGSATVGSTTVDSAAVGSATAAPPAVSSTLTDTAAVPSTVTTAPTVSSTTTIGSTTTTAPTVTSRTVGSTTTAALTVDSTSVATSALNTGTTTASGSTTVVSTTTTAPTESSRTIGSTTTIAPTLSSATTIGTSSVTSATTTAPTVSSTGVSPSTVTPTTAGTKAVSSTSVPSNIASPCKTPGISPTFFRMNIGGDAILAATMGAENENYIDSKKKRSGISMSDAATITSGTGPAPWDEAYTTYRWIEGSVLKYRIPVERGTYTVKLLFAETIHSSPNARQFDVFINGVEKEQALDVYASVGKDVGLLKEYTNITTRAFVEVALIRIVDHPMLSGIIIEGSGAGAKAVGGGCVSSTDAELEFNNGFDHRAHAVANGPYIATDLDKVGSAEVSIDGTLSHSHYTDPGPPGVTGRIVSYKWTWTEIVNGSEVKRENKDRSGKFKTRFPVGRTLMTLEVVDNTGDTSSGFAEVDVKLSTKEGAYCYGYDFGNRSVSSVPDLSLSTLAWTRGQKPQYGDEKNQIRFRTVREFGDAPLFQRSFIYRCSFFLSNSGVEERNVSMKHQGPFVLYQSGSIVAASNGSGEGDVYFKVKGTQECEVLYLRDISVNPRLELKEGDTPISAAEFAHDESKVIPVIARLSETGSLRSGGANLRIFGTGFFSDVKIFFGDTEATNVLKLSSKLLQVRIPPGRAGEVQVTVQTKVAVSNGISFLYTSADDTFKEPIIFETTPLMNAKLPQKQNFPNVASVTYGPDFRLYLGTYNRGHIHAVAVRDDYKVRTICTHEIGEGRSALGLAFSPFSNALKLYFSSSTEFWKKYMPFEEGWVNGKIETVEFSRRYRISGRKARGECSFNQQEVVTGLPVSAHDHSVNKLEFTPDGRLLITIGGFTNGGISIPGRKRRPGDPDDDRFGGVASNPFSAAIVSCPVNKVTRITYDNYTDPEKAKVVSGTDCFVYASGIRNSFGMTLHTNGHVYVTDNGGSKGNGDFATDCDGGSVPSRKQLDKLFRVERGGYHGHPNLNRGECVHYPPDAVQPILKDIESSTDGVVEYRSNVFGGQLKGDLMITKFASNNREGRISQVMLDSDGGVAAGGYIQNFYGRSGLAVVEGARGELVMAQVYQKGVLFVHPKILRRRVTFVIGVLPRRGPASGKTRLLVSGFGFSANSTVLVGDQECNKVRVLTKRKLTCLTPPSEKKNHLVSVVVESANGRSPSFGSDYWYF